MGCEKKAAWEFGKVDQMGNPAKNLQTQTADK